MVDGIQGKGLEFARATHEKACHDRPIGTTRRPIGTTGKPYHITAGQWQQLPTTYGASGAWSGGEKSHEGGGKEELHVECFAFAVV
jgi:hypothetical protein